MRSGSNIHSEFESQLERALLDRSQTVLAPRRMFDRVKDQLGEQNRRSWIGTVTRVLSLPQSPTRRVAVAIVPLAAVLIFATLVISSGLLTNSDAGVADAPPSITDSFDVPDLTVPGQDIWTVAAGMNRPRQRHGSVSLHDGRVLVFGGFDSSGPVMTTEIYDPKLDTWITVGDFPYELPNYEPPVVLHDGRVLVVGGSRAQKPGTMSTWYLRDSALFDPETNEWKLIEEFLAFGRRDAKTGLLPDGRVLLFGGTASRIFNLVQQEIFNPDDSSWTRVTDEPNFPDEYLAWGDVFGANRVVYGIGWGRAESSNTIPDDLVISLNPNTRWTGPEHGSTNFGGLFITQLSNDRLLVGTGSRIFGGKGDFHFLNPDSVTQHQDEGSGLESVNRELRFLITADGYVESVAEWWQDPDDPEVQAVRHLNHRQSNWKLIGNFPAPALEDFSVTQLGSDQILITGGTLASGRSSDASYILQLPPD